MLQDLEGQARIEGEKPPIEADMAAWCCCAYISFFSSMPAEPMVRVYQLLALCHRSHPASTFGMHLLKGRAGIIHNHHPPFRHADPHPHPRLDPLNQFKAIFCNCGAKQKF